MERYLTFEGLKKLKEELKYLETVKRREIAQRLRKAASFGDLMENAAYDEAKDAQGFLEGRIKELKQIIVTAKVSEKQGTGWVQIGSKVTIISFEDKEKMEIEIVGEAEADSLKGKISCVSPLGKVLLDKPKGAIVKVKSPGGVIKYKILEIT